MFYSLLVLLIHVVTIVFNDNTKGTPSLVWPALTPLVGVDSLCASSEVLPHFIHFNNKNGLIGNILNCFMYYNNKTCN